MRLTRPSGRSALFAGVDCRFKPASSTRFNPNASLQPLLIKLLLALLVTCTASLVHAQEYTSVVIFGDSLSDTGNVAHLTQEKYGIRVPGPIADYSDGRFTDGYDTYPAARNFVGVWVEQLAATIPSTPEVKNSLDGGTNYAFGLATTGSGTSAFNFGPSDSLSVDVSNMGQQISDYLATSPKINKKTLFVLWGGAIDLLHATSTADVVQAAINQALNVQRLIQAGGTQFIVPNLPPLGLLPRLNGSPATSIPATQASMLFNQVLADGLTIVQIVNPNRKLQIAQLNVFSLFNEVTSSPSKYSLVNVTESSRGNGAVNPDTYLFWDDIHPTTRGHNIVADAAASILNAEKCKSTHGNSQSSHCRDAEALVH
jgi:phospholipase/lecithinase/hemolysin